MVTEAEFCLPPGDLCSRAAAESPSWTAASTHLLASTTLLCARGACGNEAATLETRYLEAISRNPLSIELVKGLDAFYQAAGQRRFVTELSTDTLKTRTDQVQAVLAEMSRQ